MKTLIYIWRLFKQFPAHFVLSIMLFMLVGLLEMATVFTMAPVIDVFLHPDLKDLSTVTQKGLALMGMVGIAGTTKNMLIILLVFTICQNALIVVANYCVYVTRFDVMASLVTRLFNSFLNARWQFFTEANRGTMLNAMGRESDIASNSFRSLGIMFSSSIRALFYFAIPIYISWKIAMIAMGAGMVLAAPLLLFGKLNYRYGKEETKSANMIMQVAQEHLAAAKVVIGYGNQQKSIGELRHAFDVRRKASIKSHAIIIAIPRVFEPIGWGAMIVTVFLAHEYFAVAVAELAIIVYAMIRSVPLIGSVIAESSTIRSFTPSYEQIDGLTSIAMRQAQRTGSMNFRRVEKVIELRNVGFSYNHSKRVLSNVDIGIMKDKMTAIVGESGAGKTTVIDLIMGLYEPVEGIVSIDGIPLLEYDITSFRKRLGYVPQDNVLFNTSVRRNLLWSNESASETEIVEACKLANAHDFIVDMEEGYDTVVGEEGVRLSGGQRQRIALARALLRKPELLILDEATSSLDSQSEMVIQQAIEKIARRTTIVVIAHRLSTITGADLIYVLESGRVVEQGVYDELIGMRGKFFRMVQMQEL